MILIKISCLVYCNSEIWMSIPCTEPEEKYQVADNTSLQLFTEKVILLSLRIECLHLFRRFYWHIMNCDCEWSTFTCLCLSIPFPCLPKKALILLSISVNISLLIYSLVNFRRWKRSWVFITSCIMPNNIKR